ncbi:TPA: 16S rRNA methyltransferase [Candidatus Bathyarchaeota archaeon]|nr:16S rRNA methyltransferase [Candidatus Bathyarchaeota archaeon]
MRKLTLILAESALEIVPKEVRDHPSILKYSERAGKSPSEMLLDRSFHHAAMRVLRENWKRGRPDIVHICLLEALGSPLNKEGLLRILVHTVNNFVISISSQTRLPRNYFRFVGLIEQLFQTGKVPPFGKPLLTLSRKSLKQLLKEINPGCVIAFSRLGTPSDLKEIVSMLSQREKPVVLIGGFPAGTFKKSTLKLADHIFSIDPETLDAWTVTSRIIYEYEKSIGLPEKRLKRLLKIRS